MKTYNKSEIMKAAWNLFRMSKRWINSLNFSECLRRAWASAKKSAETADRLRHECCKIVCGSVLYLRRAVIAEAGRMGWVVYGNTFPAKKELKRMGFRWDCESKNWYTEDASVAEYFV